MVSSSSMSAAVTLASRAVQWKTFLYFRLDMIWFFQTVNWLGKRKTGTEFFHAEGVICITLLLCCQAYLSLWAASSHSEDLWSWGELHERSNAGQDHCVGEGDGDGGGGEAVWIEGDGVGGKWVQLTGAASPLSKCQRRGAWRICTTIER